MGHKTHLGHPPDDNGAGAAWADDEAHVWAEAAARHSARVSQPHVRVDAFLVAPQLEATCFFI